MSRSFKLTTCKLGFIWNAGLWDNIVWNQILLDQKVNDSIGYVNSSIGSLHNTHVGSIHNIYIGIIHNIHIHSIGIMHTKPFGSIHNIHFVSMHNICHGLAKIYMILSFILALSVYLPKVPFLQEWSLQYQATLWIKNMLSCLNESQCNVVISDKFYLVIYQNLSGNE